MTRVIRAGPYQRVPPTDHCFGYAQTMRLSPLAQKAIPSLLLSLGALACAAKTTPQSTSAEGATEAPSAHSPADPTEARSTSSAWVDSTYSPRFASPSDPELDSLLEACGRGDEALHEVALFVARTEHERGEIPSLDEVNFELRKRGSPHVAPRLWSAKASPGHEEELIAHVRGWTRTRRPYGELRCGVAQVPSAGFTIYSLVQVDVSAELSPVPTQVETGAWLELESRLLRPTTSAQIVLLPPNGLPKTLDTRLEHDTARAKFSLTTPGTWTLQLMATQEGGPLPVAAAQITVGHAPETEFATQPVPGEKSYDPSLDPVAALFVLVNEARKSENLPPLARNARLEQAALDHSRRMLAQGRISHDTGHGNPARRVELVGLNPKATGENVAMALGIPRVHRVLWNSPSHRENLLLRRWDEIGIGIVAGEDGTLFVTQLFIDNK